MMMTMITTMTLCPLMLLITYHHMHYTAPSTGNTKLLTTNQPRPSQSETQADETTLADYDSDDSDDDGSLIMMNDIKDEDIIPMEKVHSILYQADRSLRGVKKTVQAAMLKNRKTAAMVQEANKELTQQNRFMLKIREDNQDLRDLINVTEGRLKGKAPPKNATALRTYAH